MKKVTVLIKPIIFFILAITNMLAVADTISVNEGAVIFDNNFVATKPLKQLFGKYNINSDDYNSIVQATQKKWLRPKNFERWHLSTIVTTKLQKIFKKLGMVRECAPTKNRYHYVLILGAAGPTMEKRLQYLKCLIRKGISFNSIVFLTGPRILDKQIEEQFISHELDIKTEVELAKSLVDRLLIKTGDVDPQKINIVDADQFEGTRPTTRDTILAWLKTNPKENSILAISSQPFVGTQSVILRYLLPNNFKSIEVVGPRASEQVPDAVFLDNLARWIMQLGMLNTKRNPVD